MARPDGAEVIFGYDALGRRLAKTYRGKTTRWIWDGNVPLHEWVEIAPDDTVIGDRAFGADPTAVTDYAAPGPFADARMFTNEGPGSNYTLFRPDGSLGQDGFKHPIATWGNGISTTPDQYAKTLALIAYRFVTQELMGEAANDLFACAVISLLLTAHERQTPAIQWQESNAPAMACCR